MFDQLLQSFTQSPQGQRAFAQLQGQGYSPQQASGILSAALPAAARAMQGSLGSMMGGAAAGAGGAAGLGMMPGAAPQAPAAPGAQGGMLSALGSMFGGGGTAAPSVPSGGGADSVLSQLAQVGQSGYAVNFLSAAVSGMVRGQGLKNSAIDGLQGVVGGHVAEVIAAQFGLPRRVAGVAGAVVTPLMVDFLWEKFQGGGLQSMLGSGAQALGGSGPATAPGIGAGLFSGPAAAPGVGAGLFGGGGGGGYTPPRFSGWGRQGG